MSFIRERMMAGLYLRSQQEMETSPEEFEPAGIKELRNTITRFGGVAAIGAGFALAINKGYKEAPGTLNKLLDPISRAGKQVSLYGGGSTVKDFSQSLTSALTAMQDTMDPLGQAEMLRRGLERAAYNTALLTDKDRPQLIHNILSNSTDISSFKTEFLKNQAVFGGERGLSQALKIIAGGTLQSNRGKDLDELVRGMTSTNFSRSSFGPSGSFWQQRFGIQGTPFERPLRKRDAGHIISNLQSHTVADVAFGVRDIERPRLFNPGRAARFTKNLGDTSVSLDYGEIMFDFGGPDNADKRFLRMPEAIRKGDMTLVAADHKGKSFAAVPGKIALPRAGGRGLEFFDWNQGLQKMLIGDESRNIEGLVSILEKHKNDPYMQKEVIKSWNQKITGMFHRISTGQDNMSLALLQSQSVVRGDRILDEIAGRPVDTSMEGLLDTYTELEKATKRAGLDIAPLSSADSMAKQHRFSLRKWSDRWDIFGAGYPIERRFAARVRPYTLTEESLKAMEASPIGGVLPRGHGITATRAARQEVGKLPQAVTLFSLKKAKHLSPEEGFLSRRLAPMMTFQHSKVLEVRKDTIGAVADQVLEAGTPLGLDYRTGEELFAQHSKGKVLQKITNVEELGDMVRFELRTELPFQNSTKGFGAKIQWHEARQTIKGAAAAENPIIAEAVHEFQIKSDVSRFADSVDAVLSADAMKKIPQEVNKQMAEAQWIIMQKRLSETGVLNAAGKAKVKRQEIRRARGDKTYTWRGGKDKDYINQHMFSFVTDENYMTKELQNRHKAGIRLARRVGLNKGQESLGVGLEILRRAAKQGLSSDELSLIGGLHYEVLKAEVGEDQARNLLQRAAKLEKHQIDAITKSEAVLGMVTMHVGDYADFNKWGRAGIEPRLLAQIKSQNWGEAGELFIEDIARRIVPHQSLSELEKATLSVLGRTDEISGDIKKISTVREARQLLGQESFIFDYAGKQVYMPKADPAGIEGARQMGFFSPEVGSQQPQALRARYESYIRSAEKANFRPNDRDIEQLGRSFDALQQEVAKEYLGSTALAGKVIGTSGPVARTWLPERPQDDISRVFQGGTLDEVIEKFVKDKDIFTVGLSKNVGVRMLRDLRQNAQTADQVAWIAEQEKTFLSGENTAGILWRHPTNRPQSAMPVYYKMIDDGGENIHYPKMTGRYGDKEIDLSLAKGANLDFDQDRVQASFLADRQTKEALTDLMSQRAYQEKFVEGVARQTDLQKLIKSSASAASQYELDDIQVGLRKLVGVKLETGSISNLVGEMRAAAAFQASSDDFTLASYVLAEIEEGPISSKHGLLVGDIKEQLRGFVRPGGGINVREEMEKAWMTLFGQKTFTAGKTNYDMDIFLDNFGNWIGASEESGQLKSYRHLRQGVQAAKGTYDRRTDMEQLSKVLDNFVEGTGDVNAVLTREMRMGVGSSIEKSRQLSARMGEAATSIGESLKRNWKYPALGIGAAIGLSLFGGSNKNMSDHNQSIDQLGAGPSSPHIAPPSMNPNRIVVSNTGPVRSGYGISASTDFSNTQFRQLKNVAAEIGASGRIRDDRGSITPQYIQKALSERYY